MEAMPEQLTLEPEPEPNDWLGRFAWLWHGWRPLAKATAAGALVGAMAALALPAWYESEAVLAVPPVEDPTNPVAINVVDNANAELAMLGAVLHSRRILDEVAGQLDLPRSFGARNAEAARRELEQHLTVTTERKADLVTVRAEARSPAQARALVDALVTAGTRYHADLWSARIREHRARLEARLDEVTQKLAAAEDAMQKFRDQSHVVDLDEQVKASLAEAAAVEHVHNEKVLRLHFVRGFGSGSADEVAGAEREASGAAKMVRQLEKGGADLGPLLPLAELPRLEREHARLKRAVDGNASLHEILLRQLEQLRVAEARPTGMAEVVDAPSTPRLRSRPHRTLVVLEGAMLGLLVGLAALWLQRARRLTLH